MLHGAPDAVERHVGDLGNVVTDASGVPTMVNILDNAVTLEDNQDNTVLNRAIVVHAGEDDLGLGGDAGSESTGNAGGRVACGIINSGDIATNIVTGIQNCITQIIFLNLPPVGDREIVARVSLVQANESGVSGHLLLAQAAAGDPVDVVGPVVGGWQRNHLGQKSISTTSVWSSWILQDQQ